MRSVRHAATPAVLLAAAAAPAVLLLGAAAEAAGVRGSAFGFERDRAVEHSVPLADVIRGVGRRDPRDAIPPIYAPRLVAPEERVLGLERNGEARAYPVRISFDREADTVHVERADGAPVPVLRAYWFAWHAFHPESQVYSARGPR